MRTRLRLRKFDANDARPYEDPLAGRQLGSTGPVPVAHHLLDSPKSEAGG